MRKIFAKARFHNGQLVSSYNINSFSYIDTRALRLNFKTCLSNSETYSFYVPDGINCGASNLAEVNNVDPNNMSSYNYFVGVGMGNCFVNVMSKNSFLYNAFKAVDCKYNANIVIFCGEHSDTNLINKPDANPREYYYINLSNNVEISKSSIFTGYSFNETTKILTLNTTKDLTNEDLVFMISAESEGYYHVLPEYYEIFSNRIEIKLVKNTLADYSDLASIDLKFKFLAY